MKKSLKLFEHGFTIVELLVVLAILAILAVVAVPSFSDLQMKSNLSDLSNKLMSSARIARSSAITRNVTIDMCPSSNGTSCTSGGWEQGWIVLDGTNVLIKEIAIATSYKINSNLTSPQKITFDPTGAGTTQATLTVCRYQPTVGNQERVLTITATGKTTITKTTAGSC